MDCQQKQPLRQSGVYLITGGLGGIGLTLADHLAENVQATLILLGRTEFPAKAGWAEWLSSYPEGDPINQKIRQLQAMEAKGSTVVIHCVDVADRNALAAVIEQSKRRALGAIHGVIHAAGVAGGGMIQQKIRQTVEAVFAPKLAGAQHLVELCQTEALDFMLFCSSLSAFLGNLGGGRLLRSQRLSRCAGTGANLAGQPTFAINWDTWQAVGMAVNTHQPAALQAARAEALQHAILPSEGVEVLRRVLAAGVPQVVVSTGELAQRMAHSQHPQLPEPAIATPQGAHYQRPQLATHFLAAENEREVQLAAIWRELLGIDPIGSQDNFFDLAAIRCWQRRCSPASVNALGRIAMSAFLKMPPSPGWLKDSSRSAWDNGRGKVGTGSLRRHYHCSGGSRSRCRCHLPGTPLVSRPDDGFGAHYNEFSAQQIDGWLDMESLTAAFGWCVATFAHHLPAGRSADQRSLTPAVPR